MEPTQLMKKLKAQGGKFLMLKAESGTVTSCSKIGLIRDGAREGAGGRLVRPVPGEAAATWRKK